MNKIKRLLLVLIAFATVSVVVAATVVLARPAEKASARVALASYGAFNVDGDLSEWTTLERLDLPYNGFQRQPGHILYGKLVAGHYVIGLKSINPMGSNTAIWLDTDQNGATGYDVFGNMTGADYHIYIDGSGVPRLYTNGPGVTLVSNLDYAFGAGNTILEVAVPTAVVGVSNDIDAFLYINGSLYMPSDYANGRKYTLLATDLPTPTSTEKRIAIVYSDPTAKNLYSERDYTQLYASVQHQAMMSGVPYDLIHDSELMTLTDVIEYDALVLPYANNVISTELPMIEESLVRAVHNYGIGLISAGNFMSYDENDNLLPGVYDRLTGLFGLQLNTSAGPVSATITADDVSHPVMQGYGPGDLVHDYNSGNHYYTAFLPEGTGSIVVSSSPLVAVNDITTPASATAVWATETGGRNVHFGTIQYMGDRNLLWQAIQWVVYGDELAPAGLKLGRQNNLFVSRNDMDQTQFILEQQGLGAEGVTNKLYRDFLVDWKEQYNFVGSFYLNIGYDFDNPDDPNCYSGNTAGTVDRLTFGRGNNQEGLACTRWQNYGGPSTEPGIVNTYTLYLDDGHEIGSHSYTHLPPVTGTIGLYTDVDMDGDIDINDLTPAQREFEFKDSIDIIETNLSLDVTGAAGPGNPETLPVALELDQAGYMEYFSGGYSSIGAGFPSVFGRLTPDFDMVYLAPNMTFDFAMIGFFGLTPAQAEVRWQNEYLDLNQNANQPILHWPWHDYALASTEESANYSTSMFTSLLSLADGDNAEFLTADDLQKRIRAYEASQLYLSTGSNSVTAQVLGTGLGRSSLEVNPGSGNVIASVDGWYAYSDDHIFLPNNGGTFTANFDTTPAPATHITNLPMRADLQSVTGNGVDIAYTFSGEGSVFLDVNIPAGLTSGDAVISGTAVYTFTGNTLEMVFDTIGTHTGEVYFNVPNLSVDKQVTPAEVIPGRTITYTVTLTNDGRTTATGIELSDSVPVSITGVSAVGLNGVTVNGQIGTPPNYVWQISNMAAGTTGTVQITGIVDNQTASGSTFTNTAVVSLSGPERDALDNNGSTAVDVSDTTRCSLTTGTYRFNKAMPVTMQINTLGNIDCVYVTPNMGNHPGAYHAGLQANDRWWQFAAEDSRGDDASGTFSVALTLPTSFAPTNQDKLCRYVGVGGPNGHIWECGYSSHTAGSITRNNVTQFSDWVAAQEVGPTAVTLFGVQVSSDTAVVTWPLLFIALLFGLLASATAWVWQRNRS